ncbi:hypothetical protein LWF01_00455 [Saxibacter everestensis]|uniref:Transcriptional regulator, AbiEi antitoxin, Type IV TA system n=1 Tax=Saxibacter everestensis TaxID=2909229 RepID=A0ABY8QTF3_9MICO|nr:hypothetical protein LWF01_00455 [Brevibacteriaceae bacterium ZFBP1038]
MSVLDFQSPRETDDARQLNGRQPGQGVRRASSRQPSGVALPEVALALADRRSGMLLRHELVDFGLSRGDIERLVRHEQLIRMSGGVFAVADLAKYADQRYACRVAGHVYSSLSRDSSRLSPLAGPSSLVVDRLPLWRPPRQVFVSRGHEHGRNERHTTHSVGPVPQANLLVGVLSGDADERTFARTNTVRSLLDAARLTDFASAVGAADRALRRGLCDREELMEGAAAMTNLKGVARARRLAEIADGNAASPGESKSRVLMHELRVPIPVLQFEVGLRNGALAIGDFCWRSHRLIGEYDGRFKYGRLNPSGKPPEDVVWDEKRREDELRARGYSVVRWTTEDLRDPKRFAVILTEALERERRIAWRGR